MDQCSPPTTSDSSLSDSQSTPFYRSAPDSMQTLELLQAQVDVLKKKICDSEHALNHHHSTLQERKTKEINKKYKIREIEKVYAVCHKERVDYKPFVSMLNRMPAIGSKDSIMKCRDWIINNCDVKEKQAVILAYLLVRCRTESAHGFFLLNILYIINDLAYHCKRQCLYEFLEVIQKFLPTMVSHAIVSNDISEKLEHLIEIWRDAAYFEEECYEKLSELPSILSADSAMIARENERFSAEVNTEVEKAFFDHQTSHKRYEEKILAFISKIETQIDELQGDELKPTIVHQKRKLTSQSVNKESIDSIREDSKNGIKRIRQS